ncbi:glutathione S-transferase family protein [Haliangium ochraceum]|uniref:Glutathione transferase n=1 Tax=Haliangium ochraceum (strain DSM 14365 / JCM 11303 / SMP-2) TaxID=502025 RepID=D0LWD5_HALO1|nr:glutathione S-transferase C-terminal domain-containing protein [Haliangium ochraceum]ACY17585.1 Glutathione transferase [Haliangium ochraceum DSM 14365]
MGRLEDGKWVTHSQPAGAGGRYQRAPTKFRDHVTADDAAAHPAAAGRYRLYVSYACPWAQRALIVRALKKLEDAIAVTVLHPYMGEDGWAFGDGEQGDPDPVIGARFLRELYVAAQSDYTGRVSVPVLWDLERRTIVNNESLEIVRMFDDGFHGLGDPAVRLFPEGQGDAVEAMIAANYESINNGVYRCGFARSQEAYDEAVTALFDRLDECERILAEQRYLCGAALTAADVCLFTTLYRFDAVYNIHYKCSRRRLADYPNLWGYVRDLYQTPGIGETCDMDHVREHYYRSQSAVHPRGFVAAMPAHLDFDAAHGRG